MWKWLKRYREGREKSWEERRGGRDKGRKRVRERKERERQKEGEGGQHEIETESEPESYVSCKI